MIEAFGAFVIAGNYAVGIFVFVILVIINLVVITRGAGRISKFLRASPLMPCPASRWPSMLISMPVCSIMKKPRSGVPISLPRLISMAPWMVPQIRQG